MDSCCHKGSITYGIVQPGSPVNEGVPIVRVNNFRETRLDLHDVMRVAPDVEAKYGRTRLKGGEVLLTIVGSVGQVAVAPASIAGFNVARAVAVIEPLAHVSADWIALCLRSPLSQHLLGSRANTTVQTTINLKDLRALPIPLPPANERRKIETLIGALDDRITLLRETNATLEAIAQALFKSWFVDFDPVRAKMAGSVPEGMDEATAALFPDALEETELGLVPKGWQPSAFSSLCSIASGKRPQDRSDQQDSTSPVPLYGGAGVMGYTSQALFESPRILTGRVGTLGKVHIAYPPFWASDNVLVITPVHTSSFAFCYHWLCSIDVLAMNRGSTQPLLTQKDLGAQVGVVAPPAILAAFEAVVSLVFEKIRANSVYAEMLAGLRDTILPRLISGQIRLPENTYQPVIN